MEHVVESQQSVLCTVRAIEALALAAGWPTAEAFIVAMLLVGHGVGVVEAEEMFAASLRWRH
jgi:hypothetical protein